MPELPRILIVDDHVDTCDMYRAVLETMGFDVCCAYDAKAALEKVRAASFSAVVIDADMPVMNGWEFIAIMKSDPGTERLPLVMVSAHAFPETRAKALAAGCEAFFAKPCLPAQLAEGLREVMARGASAEASREES